EDNERNALVIAGPSGRVGVVQIAGLIARRIVRFVSEGQMVGAGERIGMIRFGSRVDVYLPDGVRPLVSEGQTAVAGETVIADLRARAGGGTFRVAGYRRRRHDESMIPKVGTGFRKRSCSTNNLKRDDESQRSHHAFERDRTRAGAASCNGAAIVNPD